MNPAPASRTGTAAQANAAPAPDALARQEQFAATYSRFELVNPPFKFGLLQRNNN
jgi:hypothetical protein